VKRRELNDLIGLPVAQYMVRLDQPEARCDCCCAHITHHFHVWGVDNRKAVLGGTCFTRATMAVCDPATAETVRKLAKDAARLSKRLKSRAAGEPVSSRQAIIDLELLLAVAPDLGTNIRHPARPVGTARDYLKFGITHAKKKETRQRIAGFGERLFLEREARLKAGDKNDGDN
jgi:hypothetical protein